MMSSVVADLGWRRLLAEWPMAAVVVGIVALASWRRTARQRRAAREAAAARHLARAEREQRRQAKLAAFQEANWRARRRQQRLHGVQPQEAPNRPQSGGRAADDAAFPTVGPEARLTGDQQRGQ
jgi:type II secretory pathway pseudopilin PulG